ncbi:MAG TPA: CBS domain-containing protein [Candidatus Binatia bacterium]|nr:CBS domain-containing protein [Candidatus Binatia bacterium]
MFPARVADWMKHPVHHVKPLDTVRHARALLERHRVNQLPVVVDGHLVGIITDRDLRDAFPAVPEVSAALRSGRAHGDLGETPVEDVMTRTVVTVAPSDVLTEAAQLMRRERIGALPVVEEGRLVGILTRSDVLAAFVALAAGTGEPETPVARAGLGSTRRR